MFRKYVAALLGLMLAVAPLGSALAEGAPSKEEVVAQVKKGIAFYKSVGKDKALAEFNSRDGQFAKGEDYIDVHDVNGNCVAHPTTPSLVGLNRMEAADPSGKKFIKEIVEAAKGKSSGWVTYQRKNPVDGKVESKLAYWEVSDGLIFKAGTYDPGAK
ncbi:MAG TPA: cache domain-containing protein [Steroidobacteraceae bacterium]|nr:cache domain-containing protein [Steroidobacteraceae bacterium]